MYLKHFTRKSIVKKPINYKTHQYKKTSLTITTGEVFYIPHPSSLLHFCPLHAKLRQVMIQMFKQHIVPFGFG